MLIDVMKSRHGCGIDQDGRKGEEPEHDTVMNRSSHKRLFSDNLRKEGCSGRDFHSQVMAL